MQRNANPQVAPRALHLTNACGAVRDMRAVRARIRARA